MKQTGAWVACMVLVAVVLLTGFGEKQLPGPRTAVRPVFKVGVLEESPPYDFFDENNRLSGMNIDLAREMARRLGRELELVPVSYNRIVVGLLYGQYDMIAAPQSASEERAKTVRFLTSYLSSSDVLVYRRTLKTPLKGLEQLHAHKLKLGVFNGTSYPALLKARGLENAMWVYPTQREMFLAFEAGKIDAMLMDEHIARYYRQVENYPLRFSETPVRVRKPMAFSVRKENGELAETLDRIMTDMREDGTLAAIQAKWLQKENGQTIALKGAR